MVVLGETHSIRHPNERSDRGGCTGWVAFALSSFVAVTNSIPPSYPLHSFDIEGEK